MAGPNPGPPRVVLNGTELNLTLPVQARPELNAQDFFPHVQAANGLVEETAQTFTQAMTALTQRAAQITQEYYHKAQAEINRLRNDNDHLREGIARAQSHAERLTDEKEQLNDELDEATKEVTKARDEAETAKETLEAHLEKTDDDNKAMKKMHEKVHRNLKQIYHETSALRGLLTQELDDRTNLPLKRRHSEMVDGITERTRGIAKVMVDDSLTHHDLPVATMGLAEIVEPGKQRAPPAPKAPPQFPKMPPVGRRRTPSKGNKITARGAELRSVTPAPRRPSPRLAGGSGGVEGAYPKRGGAPAQPGAGVGGVSLTDPESSKDASSETGDDLTDMATVLGVNLKYPNQIEELLTGVTAEEVEKILNFVDEIITADREPICCVVEGLNMLKRDGPYFDPNFTTKPKKWTKLLKYVRDCWKNWSGRWTDPRGNELPTFRKMIIAEVEYDKESVNHYHTFEKVFGSHCYQLWGADYLKGPAAWISKLPKERHNEHLEWVRTVQQIQSTCPAGYVGMRHINELPPAWFRERELPATQLYVNNCPELQDKELTLLLTTWCYMLWPGNCVTVSCSVVKKDCLNDKTAINQGVVALRFVTEQAARLYEKLINGVGIWYQNYDWKTFQDANDHDWESNKEEADLVWYHTKLDITWCEDEKVRAFRDNDFPHEDCLERGWGQLGQRVLWQAHFACRDHESWPKRRVKVMLNPYSGYAYWKALRSNPEMTPYLHFPDASYWDAIGCYNPVLDNTIRTADMGAWINDQERELAYQDKEFWSEADEHHRLPVLNQDEQTYEQARQRPGRAYSRGASRKPARRR